MGKAGPKDNDLPLFDVAKSESEMLSHWICQKCLFAIASSFCLLIEGYVQRNKAVQL